MRREPGRIKWRLSELLRELGIEACPYDFWVQQGAYRSRHWDLARWGHNNGRWIEHGPGKHAGSLIIYSWDTMTRCVKHGIVLTTPQDCHRFSPWEIEVHRNS